MKGFIYSAVKNRIVTLFMVVLIAMLGVYNYLSIPKQESPDIDIPVALLTTVYPGASPEDVEQFVTDKIEQEIATIDGYSKCNSESVNSVSIVIVELQNGANIDKAWDELRRKVNDIQSELPEGCMKINVNTDVSETSGMLISMSGDNYSYEQLVEYAENFKRQLKKIDGVSKFEIIGEQKKEVRVEVDPAKLNYHSLTLEEISRILQAQNLDIPTGSFEDEHGKINVMSKGTFSSIEEIQDIIVSVSSDTGVVLRLKDIANVYMDLEEDSNFKIKQNGKNAIILAGYFKNNENVITIGKDVEKKVNELKADLPEDIIFDQVLYQPGDVSEAVNSFMMNLLEGVILVILVVLIGMGFKNAIIVSTAIPVSMLITFIVMGALGIKVHQMSITALIIALGMLVDNAIVIIDAIQVRLDNGEDRMGACVNGAKEVALPVLTSTLTIMGAFLPLLLLDSVAGKFIISIPQIVMISLGASYIVAMFVTPSMAYIFFKPSNKVEKGPGRVRQFFENFLIYGLRNRKKVIVGVLIACGCSVLLFNQIGLEFFPTADNNILYIDVESDKLDIGKTEQLTDNVVEVLKKQPEIFTYTTAIGDDLPKFYYSMNIRSQSEDYAQIMFRVDLEKGKRFKNNQQMVDHLQNIFDTTIAGGTATVNLLKQGGAMGHPITLRILGNDLEKLGQTAEDIKNILQDIDGTVNVGHDYMPKQYEYDVDVNVDVASNYGITKIDVQKEISMALRGHKASNFIQGEDEYHIRVYTDIKTKHELENFAIKSSITGNKALVKQVADVKLVPKTTKISRYENEKAVAVFSDVKDGYNSSVIQKELTEKINKLDLNGVTFSFDGEMENIDKEFGSMIALGVFSILIIYLILLMQFGSLIQPLVIMLTIPLAMIGCVIGLFISRQPFSFTALLGMVSLLGIVVGNAIVLLDYINFERKQGKSIEDACAGATNQRFRPIVLSTVTTIIGLVPLVFSGSSLFTPMAITLISGLSISTFLTLVLIPIVYSIVEEKLEKKDFDLTKDAI